MTASKGMLWKTAWRRRTGGFALQEPVDMWLFNAQYKTPLPAPSFAANPAPFWYGMVGLSQCFFYSSAANGFSEGFQPAAFDPQVGPNLFIQTAVEPGVVEDMFMLGGPNAQPAVQPLTWDLQTITVMLVTVTPFGGGYSVALWVDGGFAASWSSPVPYAPSTVPVSMDGLAINGATGGPGTPTQGQISTWFTGVKTSLQTVAIPGMTSDLWNATSVAPATPPVLPNLAGGQVMNLQPGPATNTLTSVRFNY